MEDVDVDCGYKRGWPGPNEIHGFVRKWRPFECGESSRSFYLHTNKPYKAAKFTVQYSHGTKPHSLSQIWLERRDKASYNTPTSAVFESLPLLTRQPSSRLSSEQSRASLLYSAPFTPLYEALSLSYTKYTENARLYNGHSKQLAIAG